MVTSLSKIEILAAEKEAENQSFQQFLQQQDGHEVDKIVHQLNETIAPGNRLHGLWQLLQNSHD